MEYSYVLRACFQDDFSRKDAVVVLREEFLIEISNKKMAAFEGSHLYTFDVELSHHNFSFTKRITLAIG